MVVRRRRVAPRTVLSDRLDPALRRGTGRAGQDISANWGVLDLSREFHLTMHIVLENRIS